MGKVTEVVKGAAGQIVERCFHTTVPDALELPDFVPCMMTRAGVISVEVDFTNALARIRYDVAVLDYLAVQQMLDSLGVPAEPGMCCQWRSERLARLDRELVQNLRRTGQRFPDSSKPQFPPFAR